MDGHWSLIRLYRHNRRRFSVKLILLRLGCRSSLSLLPIIVSGERLWRGTGGYVRQGRQVLLHLRPFVRIPFREDWSLWIGIELFDFFLDPQRNGHLGLASQSVQ